MCGIAGMVSFDPSIRLTRESLSRMSARIAHRGPDGEGIHLNHDQAISPAHPQVGLAHRRLAIIDPDPRADQPFSALGRWLIYNGEIYNFRELRRELQALRPDYAWRTDCDTEVILVAYEVWRGRCVEHFNGMFAFAIWDERDKSLFLARDRMGQKPLYVSYRTARAWRAEPPDGTTPRGSTHGGTTPIEAIIFGSEIPALLAAGLVPADLGDDRLVEYLRYGWNAGSLYAAIGQVAPSQTIHVSHRRAEATTYFDRTAAGERMDDRSAVRQTRELLLGAVRRQLVSDVPLGVFLSGGIDSSVIAACARREGPVETFSIGFDDPRYDESAYARAVSEHLGTKHHSFRVTPDAADDLPRLIETLGQPFGDSSLLPTHYLSRATRGAVKVALSGDGGDELFGGYDRYRAMRWAARLDALPALADGASTLARALPSGHPKSHLSRARRLLDLLAHPPARRYGRILRIFQDEQIQALLPSVNGGPDAVQSAYAQFASARGAVESSLATDRLHYLPDDLLTKVDRASMRHALEVRSPFMDHELVRFAAGLDADQLLKGGPKRMLREAFAGDLPEWVFRRKKMGFAVPVGEWFRGSLRSLLHDALGSSDSFARHRFQVQSVQMLLDEHDRAKADHSARLFALLMLELWWRWMARGDSK